MQRVFHLLTEPVSVCGPTLRTDTNVYGTGSIKIYVDVRIFLQCSLYLYHARCIYIKLLSTRRKMQHSWPELGWSLGSMTGMQVINYLLLLARITSTSTRCGLLVEMSLVYRSPSVCMCWSRPWTLQNRLNRDGDVVQWGTCVSPTNHALSVGKEAEFWTGSTWARPSCILVITKIQDGRAHVLPVQNSASFPTLVIYRVPMLKSNMAIGQTGRRAGTRPLLYCHAPAAV